MPLQMRRLELRPDRAGHEMVRLRLQVANDRGDTDRRQAQEMEALGKAEASEVFSKWA
jgi:hypothetical protein